MKFFKARHLLFIAATSFFLAACNSNFDVDITSDNHPLLGANDTYTQTVHPIVLVHGLYGFESMFGMDYWYDIPEVLENGGSTVFVARVAGANSPEVRGEQLITQLEEFRTQSGSQKFHVFGHSLGAPTIRYVAAVRPDFFVSATSVAGVNYGSQAADADLFQLPVLSLITNLIGNILGHVIDTISQADFEQNVRAAINAMDKEGIAKFNASYPVGLPAVYCNGSEGSPAGFSHGTNSAYVENNPINSFDDFAGYYDGANDPGSAAGPYALTYNSISHDVLFYSFGGNKAETNKKDPTDALTKAVTKMVDGDDDDGFVERCSFHHGYVVKDNYNMNHLDFMNWVVGLRAADAPYAPSVYRAHVHYLQSIGL